MSQMWRGSCRSRLGFSPLMHVQCEHDTMTLKYSFAVLNVILKGCDLQWSCAFSLNTSSSCAVRAGTHIETSPPADTRTHSLIPSERELFCSRIQIQHQKFRDSLYFNVGCLERISLQCRVQTLQAALDKCETGFCASLLRVCLCQT